MTYHGKTYGAVSLGHIRSPVYGAVRAPGMHMVPRPDSYHPMWTKPDGTIDTDQYLAFYARTWTRPPWAVSPPSASSRSRAGAARSCPPTISCPNCASSAPTAAS